MELILKGIEFVGEVSMILFAVLLVAMYFGWPTRPETRRGEILTGVGTFAFAGLLIGITFL